MTNSESTPPPAPSTFSQLVIMIATSALQQLGQVPDPSGQRTPVSLQGAQGMIDILEMLNEKTQGNLDDEEKRMLSESLTMLRIQYVEVAQAQKQGAAPSPAATPGSEAKWTNESAQNDAGNGSANAAPEPPPQESKTRFRKSYG